MADMVNRLTGEGGEAGDALRRVQDFDPQSLVRESDLGKKFALNEAVAPARQVIELFQMIAPSQLVHLPERQKNLIRDQANSFFSYLEQASKFDLETASPNPLDAKNAIVANLEGQYQPTFDALFPLISFVTARAQDFSALERSARAAVQSAKDLAQNFETEIASYQKSAQTVLEEIRNVAAEQGVSKQAIHFKGEADNHKAEAGLWLTRTIYSAIALAIFSLISLFIHKIPLLTPTNQYEAIQVLASKILIFFVFSYVLILCARNFLSHRHNEVVNRHRQNALATFTALAEATSDAASSDIVLSHAAACIFSPQDSGYSKGDTSASESVPNIQLMPRIGQAAANG